MNGMNIISVPVRGMRDLYEYCERSQLPLRNFRPRQGNEGFVL